MATRPPAVSYGAVSIKSALIKDLMVAYRDIYIRVGTGPQGSVSLVPMAEALRCALMSIRDAYEQYSGHPRSGTLDAILDTCQSTTTKNMLNRDYARCADIRQLARHLMMTPTGIDQYEKWVVFEGIPDKVVDDVYSKLSLHIKALAAALINSGLVVSIAVDDIANMTRSSELLRCQGLLVMGDLSVYRESTVSRFPEKLVEIGGIDVAADLNIILGILNMRVTAHCQVDHRCTRANGHDGPCAVICNLPPGMMFPFDGR